MQLAVSSEFCPKTPFTSLDFGTLAVLCEQKRYSKRHGTGKLCPKNRPDKLSLRLILLSHLLGAGPGAAVRISDPLPLKMK